MTVTSTITQGPSPEDDYGLNAIAEHNAGTEQFPTYQEDTKGLGIYVSPPSSPGRSKVLTPIQHDGYTAAYQDSQSYVHNPPTPHSNSPSDGVRTRSGRSTRRTDSPFSSTTKSRVSKSPAARSKRDKKSKLDKSKTPKLTAPLSVLTKDMDTPMKDMNAWVHRPAEERQKEVEKRNGYVTRPMNSFMLYRSAYAERTKAWCTQNNHQVVSSVSGESWPMEPQEVRDQFNEWAKIERANHAAAHPEYKFSPSKSNKRRKGEDTDEEEEPSDLEDPHAEYRGGRSVRQRRQEPREQVFLNATHGFDSHPYYGQQAAGYDQSQYQYAGHARPLPSNVAYDANGMPYNPQTGAYLQTTLPPQPQYQYVATSAPRVPTPQSLGGYGLPGGQSEELFTGSRTSTPMQHYNQYGQPVYPQYQTQPYQQQPYQQPAHVYEHQQYLQSQGSQQQIDPSLAAFMEEGAAHSQVLPQASEFDNQFADLTGGDPAVLEYYDQQTSPDATLAPMFSPTDAFK